MAGCGCSNDADRSGGPFSKGKELVEFVYGAHGGSVQNKRISQGALSIVCQGCAASFLLKTYVGKCPDCGGMHAVAPMNPTVENVQFAGIDFTLPL